MKAWIAAIVLATCLFLPLAHATRWYSPQTGRWLSRDPISDPAFALVQSKIMGMDLRSSVEAKLAQLGNTPHGPGVPFDVLLNELNAYAYVGNDPISSIDPLGGCASRQDPSCGIVLAFAHGGTRVRNPTRVADIVADSDAGKFAMQATDDGYIGVGIRGCYVGATIQQVDALRTSQGKPTPNWVNKYRGAEDSLTWRAYHLMIGEVRREGPGEPDLYIPKGLEAIQDALWAGARNMANDQCKKKDNCCKEVIIDEVDLVNGGGDVVKTETIKCNTQ